MSEQTMADRQTALVEQTRRLAVRVSDRPVDAWTAEQCELLDQAAGRLHRAAMAAALWLASQRTDPAEGEHTGEAITDALGPSQPVESADPVDNLGTSSAEQPGATDLRQEPMAEQPDPEPDPSDPDAPIMLSYRTLGGRRLYRPDAPAPDRNGLVTMPFDGFVITVPDILVDAGPYPHGRPLVYLTDDQLRDLIRGQLAAQPELEGATP